MPSSNAAGPKWNNLRIKKAITFLTGATIDGDVTFTDGVATGSAWDGAHLVLGDYHIWVDGTGDLRINEGAPESATDGAVIGSQS